MGEKSYGNHNVGMDAYMPIGQKPCRMTSNGAEPESAFFTGTAWDRKIFRQLRLQIRLHPKG